MRRLKLMANVALLGCLFLTDSCINRVITDPDEQFAIDVAAIDNYLTTNGLTTYKDVTGIRFSITTLGVGGLPPRFDQEVTVQYKGKLLDGTTFDEGTVTGPLTDYILGWQRVMQEFPKGTAATIYLPSELGYGTQSKGTIPANSVLIFDIVLKDVNLTATQRIRLPADITTIDQYLTDHNITAVADTTGVRYVITQQGAGQGPGWYTPVKFNYTGKLLDGTQFFTGTAEPSSGSYSRVVDCIQGIMIGLFKLQPGGSGTFYIPSVLAFGANDNSQAPVPPNAIVVYEVELIATFPE